MELRIINKYNNLRAYPHFAHNDKYIHKYCHSCGDRLAQNYYNAGTGMFEHICKHCKHKLINGGWEHYRCGETGLICGIELGFRVKNFDSKNYIPYNNGGYDCKWENPIFHYKKASPKVYGWYDSSGVLHNTFDDTLKSDIAIMRKSNPTAKDNELKEIILSYFFDYNREAEDNTYANYENVNKIIIYQKKKG